MAHTVLDGKLDSFLQFNEEEILHDKGRVTHAMAESEYEKYKVIQDHEYVSDFDQLLFKNNNKKG